jgi:hypothetical protein
MGRGVEGVVCSVKSAMRKGREDGNGSASEKVVVVGEIEIESARGNESGCANGIVIARRDGRCMLLL